MSMLAVEDITIDIHAVCEDCGRLVSSDDPEFIESDAAEHARDRGHRVRVISKFVQVYKGAA